MAVKYEHAVTRLQALMQDSRTVKRSSDVCCVDCVAVITERDVLALSKSPFVVQLFYSLQSKHSIFLVSTNCSCPMLTVSIYCHDPAKLMYVLCCGSCHA